MHGRDAQEVTINIPGISERIPLVTDQIFHLVHLLAEDLVGPVDDSLAGGDLGGPGILV